MSKLAGGGAAKLVSILAATALFGSVSYAETILKTGEVVVTSTGFEMDADDELRNVIVIKQEDILNKGYQNLSQALSNSMGVTFVDQGGGSSIDLRGQGNKANVGVKVLVDGLPINSLDSAHGNTLLDVIDLENVERMEIIPGGGAVLYGNGTRGGVINIVTKKFGKDNVYISLKGGTFERSYSQFGDVIFGFTKNLTDQFAIQGSVDVFNHKGYRVGEKETGFYGNIKGRYSFTDSQYFELAYDHYNVEAVSAGSLTRQQVDSNPRQSGVLSDKAKTHSNIINARYNNQITDSFAIDVNAFSKQAEIQESFTEDIAGAKLKAKYDYMQGSYLIAGYDFSHSKAKRTTTTTLKKDIHSVYLLDKQALTDMFSLILGGRYEYALYDGKQTSAGVQNYDFTGKSTSNYAFEITPAMAYSDTGQAYIKYERGYISPTPSQFINKTAESVYYVNDLKNEIYDTYEVGFSDSLGFSDINLAVYYTQTTDEIYWEQQGSIFSLFYWNYINLDKTRRVGVDLLLTQSLADNALTLKESLTYINAKNTSGVNDGKKIPFVPEYKATIGATYAFGILSAYVDVSLYGKAVDSRFSKIDPYFITDIGASYTGVKNLKLTAGVRNLFDKRYYTYSLASTNTYYPADGRSYFIEGRYTF